MGGSDAPAPPFTLPFAGVEPAFAAPPGPCGAGSAVLGRVTAGRGLVLGAFATIRADGETVTVGDAFCLGHGATVHIAHGLHATVVGDRVAVGRNAVVHACRIGDDAAIEDDVVILDGSAVGDGVVIEAGSIVYPRSVLEPHGRYAGSPAVRVGTATIEAARSRGAAIRAAAERSARQGTRAEGRWGAAGRDAHFVADTAVMAGEVELGPGAGVFFGCRFAAGRIAIGEHTNVQDNTVIAAGRGEVVIGRHATLGHNVRLQACRIGDRSLVGIGAVLADETLVEEDVLVAAGAVTEPGQRLDAGWLWGGRPARPLKRLDEARRATMAATVAQYGDYGRAFRCAQEERAARPAGR